MGVGDVDESFQCPCCIQCRECKDFQKVAEIKDTGLVLFRHLTNNDDDVKPTEVLRPAESPKEDVFILQNTRNVDIPTANFVPTLETFKISCRRCRKMYERAQELLKRVPNIGENHVIGICDHCYQKQYPKSCDECEKVVDKFLSARYGERDREDKFKTMLSKMEQVLRKVTSDAVKTVRATGRANSDLYINKPSQLDSRSPGKHKERDNVMLIPEMRRSDTNIPGSVQYKPRHDKHGDSEERLLALAKSDRFKESMGAPQKYLPDQRPLSEALEAGRREQRDFGAREQREFGAREQREFGAREQGEFGPREQREFGARKQREFGGREQREFGAREQREFGAREQREFRDREQGEFGAREQRSIFEEPNRILKQRRDSNLPTSLSNRIQQGSNENIEKTQHTLGKSSGFLDPMKTQKSRRADQRHTEEDFKMGTPAHSRLGTTEPRSIIDEEDRIKQTKMRDSNMSTPQQHKSKHAIDENIKGHLQDFDKSVEFKDSIKSQKKRRPDQRYVPESVDTKQKHAGFEDRSVRSLLSEDGPIRPLVGNVLHKSPSQKQKKAVQKERSDTSVLTDKQGLKLTVKQTSKSIMKKTAPIGTRVKKRASKETLVSTISRAVQNTLGKELSYFFPVGDASGKRKKLKSAATSTALILDTQKKIEADKLRKEAEKKIELENKQKLAEEKAKLIEEKKRLAEEQKRIAEIEEKKKIADEDEKKRLTEEKKKIAEDYTKKKQAEEPDKKSRTKEHEKNQNLADAKKYDKARDMAHTEKDKGRIGHNEKDKSSSPGKNKNIDRGDVEKNKNPKLERGDKETDNNKKENEKLAQERLKREKEYKQEEKERLQKEKEQKLQQEKIDKQREKELKDAEKYKAKEEKELKPKEKNKSAEDKKARETTKYTDDADSKPKHKSEKELKEKGRKEGIEEKEKQREKELKDAEKLKAKEEKDLKAKEKNKLPEDKKARESSKYTDDTDSKPTHKGEKELNEKGRKGGIEEMDSKAKSKQMKDIKLNQDDLKQKDNQRSDKKELESKDEREEEPKSRDNDDKKKDGLNQTVEDSNIQKQEDIHMKKSGKNENQSKGGRLKDVKNTQDEIENKKRQAINQTMDNKNKPSELNKTPTAGEKEQIAETKKQKKNDSKNKQAKDLTDKNITEDAKINAGDTKTGKTQPSDGEASKTGQKIQESKLKGLNLNQPKRYHDDLIIELVKQKQVNPSLRDRDKAALIDPLIIGKHKKHSAYPKIPTCIVCVDSSLELEIESIEQDKTKPKWTDIIIGEKVMKFIPPLKKKMEESGVMPSLFQTEFDADAEPMPIPRQKVLQVVPEEINAIDVLMARTKSGKQPLDPELTKGIMRYALSDRTFIDKGWTMLPTEKVVRKMNVYRMRPAQPEFDWFEHNKNKRIMLYDSGERLAEFDDNGRGRWYYKNGHLALDYYDAEEINANQRFVLYSSGEPDERGRSHPVTILATFDYSGNGVVFDHAGKIRLKYNQTEGVVLDRGIGPVSHWKWHTLNDPPVLQQVMIDTQMPLKDPEILKLGGPSDGKPRTDNEEMLAIEFDNFIKEKSKKLTQSFKPFQIKMKALKINEHFSLKVMDQATVYLIYRDGSTNLKINIGMILDHKEIVDTDTAEVGEVSSSLERFPARTESLAGIQKSVAYAQRFERSRTERERRLRPPEQCSSADRLVAAAARPLHPAALRTAPTPSASASGCYCNVRKSSSCQIYYNTRLT